MCGIHAIITSVARADSGGICEELIGHLKDVNSRRGPDFSSSARVELNAPFGSLQLGGSVLHLRGEPTSQPLRIDPPVSANTSAPNSWLLWNGEIFSTDEGISSPGISDNDTMLLARMLSSSAESSEYPYDNIPRIMAGIRGPWAFIFWDGLTKRLWFGRDYFGRRSLVWRRGQALDEPFVLSSAVPISNEAPHISDSLGRLLRGWEEVPADGLYYLDLSSEGRNLCSEAIKIKWGEEGLVSPVSEMNTDVPTETIISQSTEPLILRFLSTFEASVRRRVEFCHYGHDGGQAETKVPPVAILFSGGIDSMMIATILHRVLPGGMAIDLINVAFASPKVVQGHTEGLYATPDRITAIDGLKELEFACLGRTWNLVKVNVDSSEVLQHRERVRSLIAPLDSVLDDSIGLAIWFAARGRGVLHQSGEEGVLYETSARILLLGMGADEQLGGYS